ncbi:MAG: hypothetical protein PHW31_03625 [Candidatus Pacebacteria bacterium]|nr:hypothetical protein [Candidatus Paceibacterota bacterium]
MAEAVDTIESSQNITGPVRGGASNGAGYIDEATEAEEEQESVSVPEPSFLDALFTAEGMVMFGLAVIVDVLEVVLDLTGVGALVALALDIAAYAIIGGWMMTRGSDVKVSKRAGETLKKAAKEQFEKISSKQAKWAKRLKWMRPVLPLFEMIPFISIVPCWIAAVYFELKYGKSG